MVEPSDVFGAVVIGAVAVVVLAVFARVRPGLTVFLAGLAVVGVAALGILLSR